MNWKPFELHTHTAHSDGDFTLAQLVETAAARGFTGVALTDHNTVSGVPEFRAALEKLTLCGINGIEWTTYYGHMLVLGERGITDWRQAVPSNIDEMIEKIHANGGIVGVAHPFALSSPVNTGYSWRFAVQHWEHMDYIEVWSRNFAPATIQSDRAFRMWEGLLAQGYHIAATSGRDWHRPDATPVGYGFTYLGFEGEMTEQTALDAVRRGRLCITAGPLLTMHGVTHAGHRLEIGDTLACSEMRLFLSIDTAQNLDEWKRFGTEAREIRIINNGRVIASCAAGERIQLDAAPQPGYLRADLFGSYHGREDCRIAFTNPVYLTGERGE